MIFMLSQGWTNETVEYEMDLVDSAVKSLRSLSNERWERYMESIFKKKKKKSSSFVFWINFCLCMSDSIVSGIAVE